MTEITIELTKDPEPTVMEFTELNQYLKRLQIRFPFIKDWRLVTDKQRKEQKVDDNEILNEQEMEILREDLCGSEVARWQ